MNVAGDKNTIEELLERRVVKSYPSQEEVKNRLISGEKLKFYYGIDPTGPYIHLGHVVQLQLLNQLSKLGHEIIILVGDFTAKIGDPTDKEAARKPLSDTEILANQETYIQQIKKILPEGSFRVDRNSRWLKEMNLEKIIELAANFSVQQMIVRDMFQERLKKEKPIGIHEFIYPLMQGYDSVAMQVDGEIGGNDQTFNMLVGRDLVKKYLNKEKIVLATKLIVDETTGKKMSKSEGEIIAINDEPSEVRRKILAMDDRLIKVIFELCTAEEQKWIDERQEEVKGREFKELLSDKLVELFHGKEKIKEAHEPIEGSFVENLAVTIKEFGFASSISEAKQLVTSGAVGIIRVNGKSNEPETETNWKAELKSGDIIKVGKGKFGKIK